jgi:hypothetical protein
VAAKSWSKRTTSRTSTPASASSTSRCLALELPDDEPARDFAFARLARFLEMHIVLDEVVNASRPDAEQELLEPMESPKSPW